MRLSKLKTTRRRILVLLALVSICFICAGLVERLVTAKSPSEGKAFDPGKYSKNEKEMDIDAALFARTEFFGAQAIVRIPTAEARNRLADLVVRYSDEPQIQFKLSELDEKLGRLEDSEQELRKFVELRRGDSESLATLAAFLDRRAKFDKEAEVVEKMLDHASFDSRVEIFNRLIELARVHGLENYLKPEFYAKYVSEDEAGFAIVEQLLDKLVDDQNFERALTTLRQYKDRFPERRSSLLEKEVSILVSMERDKEAEGVYQKAFDPFWDRETSSRFYGFLSDHDRLRAYGQELSEAFTRN